MGETHPGMGASSDAGLGQLWLVAVKDLAWRRRRFVMAVVATSLVFALALIGTGVRDSLSREPAAALDALGADALVVPQGGSGPFGGLAEIGDATVEAVRAGSGVDDADVMLTAGATAFTPDETLVQLVGHVPGGVASPEVSDGRAPTGPGEAAVGARTGLDPGDVVEIRDRRFEVVGVTDRTTVSGGRPLVFLAIDDAQELLFGGLPLANALVVEGQPDGAPEGYEVMGRLEAENALREPLAGPIGSLDLLRVLLWFVAATIVGLVLYLSAIERTRDFAVLKATGSSTTMLALALAIQAVVVAVVAAVIGVAVARVLAPAFPLEIPIPNDAAWWVPALAVVIGLAGSLVGLRRAVTVDPALAFGS